MFPDFSPLKDRLILKKITGSKSFCQKLLENTGVALLPGEVFGRPAEELTVRIAYIDFDGVRAISAAENIESKSDIDDDFIFRYCANTIEAIDKICEWVKT